MNSLGWLEVPEVPWSHLGGAGDHLKNEFEFFGTLVLSVRVFQKTQIHFLNVQQQK
jgi:hypothetical protein